MASSTIADWKQPYQGEPQYQGYEQQQYQHQQPPQQPPQQYPHQQYSNPDPTDPTPGQGGYGQPGNVAEGERGLGATLLGGSGGAFLGHKYGGGGLGTVGGLIAGAVGANLVENFTEK